MAEAMDKKTKDKYSEQQLASEWNFRFKDAMVAKAPYTKQWQTYMDAYNGDYFKNENIPEYKSDLVSNYIFSIIETIRPIMLDNDPKFQSMPRQPKGMEFSNDLNQALLYEWDRESMNKKLYRELIPTLVYGTSVFFLPWNSEEKNVQAIPVDPFNLFPDPLATCVEDAEYIIYASYKNVVRLKRRFKDKAERLHGGTVKYSELVHDNDKNARVDNQVLVLEVWTWNYEDEERDEKVENKYPNGRVLVICPELGIVLEDKANPYKSPRGNKGTFPFQLIKDYDIPGKFWGEGEVAQLLSPQKYMNQLNNAILDNAKATANMPWIVDKNAGIGYGKITARPGLVIRKNQGSEVRRDQPPQMPMYITDAVNTYKDDIQEISGIFNTLKGDNATGVYTAQGILALQEAGQVRIRLKVKLMEESLGKLAQMWYDRMRQFWKEDRWLSLSMSDGEYDLKKFTTHVLEYDYDIKITAGSTMPVNRGAMLDLMIRLAQTPMPDGQNLVDREAVVEYLPEEIKSAMLRRMKENNANMAELQQAVERLGQALQEMGQGVEQGMQEMGGQLEAVAKESHANDEQTFSVIDEIASTIEHVNKQILQLQEEHDRLKQEQEETAKIDQIKKQAYNKGYEDAEEMYEAGDTVGEDLDEMEGLDSPDMLPDDILEGLEDMSDEELALLLESNPELMDLIK